jgi:small conductance mechanosensitive channel
VFRPFKVGDVINAAGITAKVYEIDLFTTIFDTPDNRRIIVPNSSIASGTIENISHHEHRRVDVVVGVDYAATLQQTRDTLTAAAESLKDSLVEGDGRGYQIVLGDLGDSAVGWTVRFWTTAADYWSVKECLTAAVKEHLDAQGIGIPFPQMDVHLHQS